MQRHYFYSPIPWRIRCLGDEASASVTEDDIECGVHGVVLSGTVDLNQVVVTGICLNVSSYLLTYLSLAGESRVQGG